MHDTIAYKNYTITIDQDDLEINPLTEYDCFLGTMYCWHGRYGLGHEQPDVEPNVWFSQLWAEHGSDDELREIVLEDLKGRSLSDKKYRLGDLTYKEYVNEHEARHPNKRFPDAIIALPLYLYDHSGITISTGSFSCPWDSGQVGWIIVTREKLEKEKLGERSLEEIEKLLDSEVKIYDQYLTGDIWYYEVLDPSGESIDGCGGMYGYDYTIEETKAIIDKHIETNVLPQIAFT